MILCSYAADQSSKYHFSFHDETVVSSHLALSSGNQDSDFEMMRTQLCLEGTATYDTVNIITVLTILFYVSCVV